MPDTLPLAQVAQEPTPTLPVQPYPVWSALRTQLLADKPEPECIRRIRALLFYLYDTDAERVRGLHALFTASPGSPAVFQVVARECGWSDEMSARGLGWELMLTAAIFGEVSE